MARETFKHNGETRDSLNEVGSFNVNFEPYETIEFLTHCVNALRDERKKTNQHLEWFNNFLDHVGNADSKVYTEARDYADSVSNKEETNATIFINAVQNGL
jgi:hypothetical protein